MPFSQIIPRSPSPTESKRVFYTSVSLVLSRIHGYHYHLSKFHIYALVYCIGGEGNGNPLQYSCLENSMDGGPWFTFIQTSSPSQHSEEHLEKEDLTLTLTLPSTPLGAALPQCFASITYHPPPPGFGLSCQALFRSHKETCDITYPLNGPFPS